MFSNEPRVRYENPQLVEVICQLRFPEILTINASEPAAFQERIRRDYPLYSKRAENAPPRLADGKPVRTEPINNYQFLAADSRSRINLTQGFVALSTHGYGSWEQFAGRLDAMLAAFIETYHPSWFTRVGLRYVNAFHRESLGLEGRSWKELIEPPFLGLLSHADVEEGLLLKNEQSVTLQMPGGTKANIKCGPGVMRRTNTATRQTQEQRVFMLDLDLFMDGRLELSQTAPALSILHNNADDLFRGAVTDTLHEAMGPTEL